MQPSTVRTDSGERRPGRNTPGPFRREGGRVPAQGRWQVSALRDGGRRWLASAVSVRCRAGCIGRWRRETAPSRLDGLPEPPTRLASEAEHAPRCRSRGAAAGGGEGAAAVIYCCIRDTGRPSSHRDGKIEDTPRKRSRVLRGCCQWASAEQTMRGKRYGSRWIRTTLLSSCKTSSLSAPYSLRWSLFCLQSTEFSELRT